MNISVGIDWLFLHSLATALFLIAVLIRLLCQIESTFRTRRGVPPPEPIPARTVTWRTRGEAAIVTFTLFLVFTLFTLGISPFNKLQYNLLMLAGSAVLSGALGFLAERRFLRRLRPFSIGMLGIGPIKESVMIAGTMFALFAGKIAALSLTKSTNSNMAAVYGQIYNNDNVVADREVNSPGLQRLYLQPDFMPKVGEGAGVDDKRPLEARDFDQPAVVAQAYWSARLENYLLGNDAHKKSAFAGDDTAFANDTRTIASALTDVKKLTDFVESADTTPNSPSTYGSRAFIHLTQVFNNMHQAYDYGSRGVVALGDTETWLGYFEDYGPHPLALATLWNWLEYDYMTRPFYAIAELRVSGKRELFTFLKAHEQDDDAAALARELAANAVTSARKAGVTIAPLGDAFYRRMAGMIERHRDSADAEATDALFRALAKLAVFNRYVVAARNYSDLVGNLVDDENYRALDTVEKFTAGRFRIR